MAKHNEIGKIGEDIAAQWIRKKGFEILERNYRKKWGEIDIVARGTGTNADNGKKIHFIEVKTVSYETKGDLDRYVSHGTWRPEENVHRDKLKRLGRAIETWISENRYEGCWQIDVVTVAVVPREKYACVKYIENIILE